MKTFRKNQASRFSMLSINKSVLSEASSPLSRGGFFLVHIYAEIYVVTENYLLMRV